VNPSPWFVCPRAVSNAGTRLFLFPYAGGGPAVFGKWPAELSSNMEAWIAHYPGRGSRHNESPIKELDNLAGKLSQAIQPLLDKPFAFFGHSMGGLVAFELARHLRKNGLPQPITLFVSGCGAPHLPDPHPAIHTLPDAEFLNALRQFKGIPSELLQLPDAVELLLPTLRADFEAVESYIYNSNESPLDCPIIAFGGLDDRRVSQNRLESWAVQTNSGFKSIYFSGDHFFIDTAKDKIVRSIAAEMMSSLAVNRKSA
jgi:medium-chain acyl-[acyl-carrier-protein] hydrolase